MSLYNMLFGENPAAEILLGLLGLTRKDFYRYRDCYLSEQYGKVRIAVHTRGGGGNRAANTTNVSDHQEYLYDQDDDFDHTYCTYYFRVPEAGAKVIELLKDMEAVKRNPTDTWNKFLNNLKNGNQDDPMVQHALEVGKKIFSELEKMAES